MEDMSASSETILEGLDDAQMSAVTALDGPVRIIAGAGAGKTRTVTRRIAYACARISAAAFTENVTASTLRASQSPRAHA